MALGWLCSGALWFAQSVPSYPIGGGTGRTPDPAVPKASFEHLFFP